MRSSSSDTCHARLVLHPFPRLLLGSMVPVGSGHNVSMLIRDGSRRLARAKKPLLRKRPAF
jgi:hypothetical protein